MVLMLCDAETFNRGLLVHGETFPPNLSELKNEAKWKCQGLFDLCG